MAQKMIHFLRILWAKNSQGQSFCGGGVRLPHTIFIENGVIKEWYFSSSQKNNAILRKHTRNLSSENIISVFNKECTNPETLAFFEGQFPQKWGDKNAPVTTSSIYLGQKELKRMVNHLTANVTGILQSFIQPNTINNHCYTVSYTPVFCLYKQRVNKYFLTDNVALKFKLATFEGPDYLVVPHLFQGEALKCRLDSICQGINTHVTSVIGQNRGLKLAVYELRVDTMSRLWLLWVSDYKFESKSGQESEIQSISSSQRKSRQSVRSVTPIQQSNVQGFNNRPRSVNGIYAQPNRESWERGEQPKQLIVSNKFIPRVASLPNRASTSTYTAPPLINDDINQKYKQKRDANNEKQRPFTSSEGGISNKRGQQINQVNKQEQEQEYSIPKQRSFIGICSFRPISSKDIFIIRKREDS
ncbi:MAG: hypothetical protein EZS28_006885 [Streblomastix strix]|uniref:Uncharacterized protein n=1 Tax=Streblomastix strix TaxID=222440 RepID=A0A5J4WS09_9EUKA|nr:MAG: hypothetical protein EZS28_006885 [Streblomastix strix]